MVNYTDLGTSMKRYTHKAGEKAYLDTLRTGLVPVIVQEVVHKEPWNARCLCLVTKEVGPYKKGELLDKSAMFTIPRTSVFKRDGQYKVREDFRWE